MSLHTQAILYILLYKYHTLESQCNCWRDRGWDSIFVRQAPQLPHLHSAQFAYNTHRSSKDLLDTLKWIVLHNCHRACELCKTDNLLLSLKEPTLVALFDTLPVWGKLALALPSGNWQPTRWQLATYQVASLPNKVQIARLLRSNLIKLLIKLVDGKSKSLIEMRNWQNLRNSSLFIIAA